MLRWYVCVYIFSSASHFVIADEQRRGEWFKDIEMASEKHHVKIPPQQTSAKKLALLQLQSQTLSQNTSIFVVPCVNYYPISNYLLLISPLYLNAEKKKKSRAEMAWLFICGMK